MRERGSATLAISGGSSPKPMFEIFARSGFAWDHVHLFWVDERVVPPTDPQSNFKLANDTWLAPREFPAPNIHRVQTELGAEEAARDYQAEILRILRKRAGRPPPKLRRDPSRHGARWPHRQPVSGRAAD